MNYVFESHLPEEICLITFSDKSGYYIEGGDLALCNISEVLDSLEMSNILEEAVGWKFPDNKEYVRATFKSSTYVGKKTDEELIEYLEDLRFIEELKK